VCFRTMMFNECALSYVTKNKYSSASAVTMRLLHEVAAVTATIALQFI